MYYTWVIGVASPRSNRGKNIIAHANVGVGYVILNKARAASDDIKYAFRFAVNQPIPHHLTEATPEQSTKLDERF